ncbi:MAG: 1-phosphofructokinase [Faecalibacterium sp.]|jgi:1-phosphofructokinase|nr:1-phosphofructokinase [Faecalibacterium sp.]
MIFTVTLNPAVDYVVHLPGTLRQGSVNRAAAAEIQFGGKGINVSLVLRALGAENTALGFTAGHTGEWLAEALAQQGLHTDFIRLPAGETRINVKLKAGTETDVNAAGPAIPPEAMAALREKLAALGKGDTLVLAGSIPAGLPADTYAALAKGCTSRGVSLIVDAEGEALLQALSCRPFCIKPNREELGGLFGRALRTDTEVAACAEALRQKGARNVLVSLGGEGALLLDETGQMHRTFAPAGTVKNSVGAGDSMVAGFLAGWRATGSYAEALRWGAAAGSATAFSEGLADGESIRKLLAALPPQA